MVVSLNSRLESNKEEDEGVGGTRTDGSRLREAYTESAFSLHATCVGAWGMGFRASIDSVYAQGLGLRG